MNTKRRRYTRWATVLSCGQTTVSCNKNTQLPQNKLTRSIFTAYCTFFGAAAACEAVSGKSSPRTIDKRMELFLHLIVSVKMDSYSKGNYISMKGVFLGENHILDNVGMSLASAEQIANTSTYRYCLYLRNKYYGRAPICLHCLDKKTVGKKWVIFFSFLFPRDTR